MVEVRLGTEQAVGTNGSAAPALTAPTVQPAVDPDICTVVDRRGRTLVVQRPELLMEFQFAEAAGAEAAANQTWMGMAMPLIYLVRIDEQPAPRLLNKLVIDGLIRELGREGYSALMLGINQIVKNDADQEQGKIKNS